MILIVGFRLIFNKRILMGQIRFVFLFVVVMFSGVSYAQQSNFDFDTARVDAMKSGLLKEVDDPATIEAMMKFNEKMAEIGNTCPQPEAGADMQAFMTAIGKCICSHLPEIAPALQAKIDAFANLLKRQPELANAMVVIKGVPGNIMLNPAEVNEKAEDQLKIQYNCQ